MIPLGIILILIAVLLAVGLMMDDAEYDGSVLRISAGLAAVVALIITGAMVVELGAHPKPSALDVYRGRTELRITKEIVNNRETAVDSVVVYK